MLTFTTHGLGKSTFSPKTLAKLLKSNKVFVSRVLPIGDVHGVFHSAALNNASTNLSLSPGVAKAEPQNARRSLPRSMTGKRCAAGHLSRIEITDSMCDSFRELVVRRGGVAVKSSRSAKISVRAALSSGYTAKLEVV